MHAVGHGHPWLTYQSRRDRLRAGHDVDAEERAMDEAYLRDMAAEGGGSGLQRGSGRSGASGKRLAPGPIAIPAYVGASYDTAYSTTHTLGGGGFEDGEGLDGSDMPTGKAQQHKSQQRPRRRRRHRRQRRCEEGGEGGDQTAPDSTGIRANPTAAAAPSTPPRPSSAGQPPATQGNGLRLSPRVQRMHDDEEAARRRVHEAANLTQAEDAAFLTADKHRLVRVRLHTRSPVDRRILAAKEAAPRASRATTASHIQAPPPSHRAAALAHLVAADRNYVFCKHI